MGIPIDREEDLSVSDFHSRYSEPERPVVLVGALRGWASLKAWTPDYLKSVVGKRPVKVARSPAGGEYFDPDSGVDHAPTLVLPFDEFIDRAFDRAWRFDGQFRAQHFARQMDDFFTTVIHRIQARSNKFQKYAHE